MIHLGAGFGVFALLPQRQRQIVVRFAVARLEADRLAKLPIGSAGIARLQKRQPQIVVAFREIRIAPQNFTEDIRRADGVVFPAQEQ